VSDILFYVHLASARFLFWRKQILSFIKELLNLSKVTVKTFYNNDTYDNDTLFW